jgi:hypothetical protein
MARAKLTAWTNVHALPHRNVMLTESHSDGQNAAYLPGTLRTVVLALGYSEPPLFISAPRLLHGNSYLWLVQVIIYERPTTDHICRIHHVVNMTLVLENHRGVMERKHKLVRQHQPAISSRPRVATSSAGPVFHPA